MPAAARPAVAPQTNYVHMPDVRSAGTNYTNLNTGASQTSGGSVAGVKRGAPLARALAAASPR